MAGTATNYDVNAIAQTAGLLWGKVAIPTAGARLTLHTDGTPDATANPEAMHLGMTREGAAFSTKPEFTEFFADEFEDPIKKSIARSEAVISAELLQVMDTEIAELMLPGSTRTTASGYEQVTFGGSTSFTYNSFALIFPTEADNTKFGVFQLYKAINDGGLAVEIGRTKLSGLSVALKGQAVTSRAAGDTTGSYWKQVA